MKNILAVTLLLIGLSFANQASAKVKIPFATNDEKLITVVDLPNDENTLANDGKYVNIGYFYKQVWILWIPLWNYDDQYCLLKEGDGETYYTITDPEAKEYFDFLVKEYDVKLAGNPISLWHKMGGKAIVLLLILLIIWSQFGSKKKDEEETAGEDTEEQKQ